MGAGSLWKQVLWLGGGLAVAGCVATYFFHDKLTYKVTADAGSMSEFWNRFYALFVLSVLIERAVETYLNVTRQNGGSSAGEGIGDPSISETKRAAMLAALALSMLVALSGVRIIETIVELKSTANFFSRAVWYGVDIVVSAGLMAGGADLFHQVAGVLTTGLTQLRTKIGGNSAPQFLREAAVVDAAAAAKTFSIIVSRPKGAGVETGKIRFTDGAAVVEGTCWWDKDNRIDPGTYNNCSKTRMTTYGYDAIYLPDAISKVTGAKEIFIHRGAGPQNSRGCIAVEADVFATIYKLIDPPNAKNVTVSVQDV
jgi:hypothetical protein